MDFSNRTAFGLYFLALTAGASALPVAKAQVPSDVIARSAASQLTGTEIRALVEHLPQQEKTTLATDRSAFERSVRAELVRRAVLAEAKSHDFERDPAVVAQVDHLREELLVRQWISRQVVVPSSYPSEDEIKAAYATDLRTTSTAAEYHLAQILVTLPDGADGATVSTALHKTQEIAKALEHTDFAQVAKKQSDEPLSAAKGGDLGLLPDAKLLPTVAAVIHSMALGAVAGPIKISQGFVFVKLVDKKNGPVPSLAQVRDQLVLSLRSRRAAEMQQQYVSQLSDKLGVTVNEGALTELQRSLQASTK